VSKQARAYSAQWDRFRRLESTQDSLMRERRGWRRLLLRPTIAFVLPISDPVARARLAAWQETFRPWLLYDPQPPDRLHVTLCEVGSLCPKPWLPLPNTWRRSVLPALAGRMRQVIESFAPLEVQIGSLNAFANVLFAEIRDPEQCLRLLRVKVRRALPLRARHQPAWIYLPHVTLGYWGQQPTAPIIKALRPYRTMEPLPLSVNRVWLTVYTPTVLPLGRDLLTTAQEDIIAEFELKR
jgi:2'-5' RNA ligase